jgi:phasin
VTRSHFLRQAIERDLSHYKRCERRVRAHLSAGDVVGCLFPSVALMFEKTTPQEFTGELIARLRISACAVTQEAVITNTNLNPMAREPYRKGSNRLGELLETPFPRVAREFAEKTVDQTREAYERSNRTLEAAMQTLEKSFDSAGQGINVLRRKIFDIAEKNLNLGFDLAKNLASARNLSEIVELQAAFWRKQFDAFTTPSEEVRNRVFEFGAAKPKTAVPSSEAIHHEPAKKAPPRAQETPKKEQSLAARDRFEGQRRTHKLEAPPDAGPAGVRPTDKRQLRTRKKGTPEKEPVPESQPAQIKFGILDGNAVRFTNLEAWWLVDGSWRPISAGEVLLNAAVMREARFNQLFPEVPRLPSNAFKFD